MAILGIESATMVASAAVIKEGCLLGEYVQNSMQTHSQRLLPVIHRLLDESGLTCSDIKGIAVSVGPGSFTGLRIGMATAKALAQAWHIPLFGISTLDALAQSLSYVEGMVCPILDAQKGQVYTRLFQGNGTRLIPLMEPVVVPFGTLLEELALKQEKVYFLGEESSHYITDIKRILGDRGLVVGAHLQFPRASNIAYLGEHYKNQGKQDEIFSLSPLYIKKSEAEIVWEKRREEETHGIDKSGSYGTSTY